MVTKEFTYKKAFENKRQGLKKREFERELLLNSLYETEPRLTEIEDTLKALGARLALTALSGDKASIEKIKNLSKKLTAEKEKILKKGKIPQNVFECQICNDTGYVSGKICECIKRSAAQIMVTELSKEMPLGECRFDNFDLKYYSDETDSEGSNPRRRMTAILKMCKDYAEKFNTSQAQNLLFMGGVGLGKTHLTMAIVAEVVKKGYLPVYGSAENIFTIIENEKFAGDGKGNYETILNCDLLVLDDLGAEMVNNFTKSALYNLINTRILSNKPTIINTNLSMAEIQKKYDPRISSRLIGEYNWNKFLGEDIRQQKLLEK